MPRPVRIRERKPRKPFGMLCAILAACFAFAVGILCGHDPSTIVYRAVICGTVFGTGVRICLDFIRLANIRDNSNMRSAGER